MITTPAFPVGGSPDYYIRISSSDLARVAWEHSYSQTTSIVPMEGMTEWIATVRGLPASIAWAWACCDDGHIRAMDPVLVLSNVMVTDHKGYDLPPAALEEALRCAIEPLKWQATVRSVLDRSSRTTYH